MEEEDFSSSASDGGLGPSSSSTSDSPSVEEDDEGPLHYNPALSLEHNYLGNNLEELRGRTVLDDGSYQVLPLLAQPGMILIPGQTLPLKVFFAPTVRMLRQTISSNGTFGVVALRRAEQPKPNVMDVGTTAEIYEYCDDDDGSGFRVKAKGRQRFQLIESKTREDRGVTGTVRILPEITLPPSLYETRLRSLDRLREPIPNIQLNASKVVKCRTIAKRDAVVTPWPYWVHDMYNVHYLTRRIKSELSYVKVGSTTSCVSLPHDPVELSFYVANALPLLDDQKLCLLRLNSCIQRLRWEISALSMSGMMLCKHCQRKIADPRETFSMSVEGPTGTYVNPSGYVHDLITVHRAPGLRCANNEMSLESSWFPGYAWSVGECRFCGKHSGWRFNATHKSMHPQKFYGVSRRAIVTQLFSENIYPVM